MKVKGAASICANVFPLEEKKKTTEVIYFCTLMLNLYMYEKPKKKEACSAVGLSAAGRGSSPGLF